MRARPGRGGGRRESMLAHASDAEDFYVRLDPDWL